MAKDAPPVRVLMLCGDNKKDYKTMIPFHALQPYEITVDAVYPGKKAREAYRMAVHQILQNQPCAFVIELL